MNILQQLIDTTQQYQAQLIAVSKTKPIEAIKELYVKGQLHFGENRVQELCEKYEALPKDIRWHLIGHLQSNKVKYIVPFVHCIHSIDSLKLLQEVQKEGAKIFRRVNVLLQFHIAQEETKFGLNLTEAQEILEVVKANPQHFEYVNIIGVMGMATFTNNQTQIAEEFASLQNCFTILKNTYFPLQSTFTEISMGMSSDYQLALENGSTMVRVGSLLFA